MATIVFPFFSLFGASRFLTRVFFHVACTGCFYSSTNGLACCSLTNSVVAFLDALAASTVLPNSRSGVLLV